MKRHPELMVTDAISVLIIDDSADDAHLLVRELRKGNFEVHHKRVDDADGLRDALNESDWDIVLSDYTMPYFDSFTALKLVKETKRSIPFIVVSGTVGEEVAVEVMKSGASDYLSKGNLIRLVPTVQRVLKEAESLRRVEHDLSVSEERLRQAQNLKAIGQLTGGIAHDFNNILAIIIGYLELIKDRSDMNISDMQDINIVLEAATRAAELTSRLQSFSRQRPLSSQCTQINELLDPFFQLAQRTIGEDISIELNLSDDLWPVLVDGTELEVALLNLAINARDAMVSGGRLSFKTDNQTLGKNDSGAFEELVPGDYVMISVTDNGSGMSPIVREHAFEPYYTTKEFGAGSGMGLSMVFGFVRQSGGQVVIKSKSGQGTTVEIYLPRTDLVPQSTTTEEQPKDGRLQGHETILVVEDDAGVRNFLQTALTNLGYAILSAKDGQEALDVMSASGEIDMLLTDLILPYGMNGREVAGAFMNQNPTGCVLFSSGYPGEILESRGHINGDMDLLNKPYRYKSLAQRIRRSLDTK